MPTEPSTAEEPTPSRPHMPGYGLPNGSEGLMPWSWAEERLQGSHNYWLATVRPDGRPHLMVIGGCGAQACSTSAMRADILALREPIFAVRPSVAFGLDEKAALQSATRWRFPER